MEERCLGTRNLLVSYMLRKARVVVSTEAGQKTVQLSDTDQNNPTSVCAIY